MLTRKRQIPFYAGVHWEWLPFADLEGVLAYAADHEANYIALDARTTVPLRPQLIPLLDPTNAPGELSMIYYDETTQLVVYRIQQ